MLTRKGSLLRVAAMLPLLAGSLGAAPAPDQGDPRSFPDACASLVGSNGEVVIDAATPITPDPQVLIESSGFYRAVPVSVPFCRVEGRIESTIGFELWLPDDWNGRLLGAGVGGDAGQLNLTDLSLRLAQGFASVTTDSGHSIDDAHWMLDPAMRENYEHRAVHLTNQAARTLVRQVYDREVDHAYFTGCSGGGRQALKEMQLYPEDYGRA